MPFTSQNPATEQLLATFPDLTPEEREIKLARAAKTFISWRQKSFTERGALMRKLATILREQKRALGMLMAQEMGKPITSGMGEADKCAWVCEWYAEHAERLLADELIATDAKKSFIHHNPLGIILAVMPWNFPFWQVMRFAAPALMAGNVGILKHASNVPQCALALERLFHEADFPEGAFQTLLIRSSEVASLIRDPRIQAVTLTGSEHAGSEVAATAGREIKKTVLELGGSDPFIVLADADLSQAAQVAAQARLQNAGQSCIAAKRFIVVRSVAEKFLALFAEQIQCAVVGDPLDGATTLGPMATKNILEELEKQVQRSVELGARVVIGGKRREGRGYFYEPTILAEIKPGMPAYDEELFGPVASFIVVADTAEAIRVANDTPFGLGASVWTNDVQEGERCADAIEAGCVCVNQMVKSDPRLPFGGIKKSGYGRELSRDGIREFVNIKTVVVA